MLAGRLTTRCSGPGTIKCSAAGEGAHCLVKSRAPRVLERTRPAAERGRPAT